MSRVRKCGPIGVELSFYYLSLGWCLLHGLVNCGWTPTRRGRERGVLYHLVIIITDDVAATSNHTLGPTCVCLHVGMEVINCPTHSLFQGLLTESNKHPSMQEPWEKEMEQMEPTSHSTQGVGPHPLSVTVMHHIFWCVLWVFYFLPLLWLGLLVKASLVEWYWSHLLQWGLADTL